jgi:hypothetical protein
MSGSGGSAAANGPREWWQSPPRSGLQRLINPWEYRHLRFSGATRIAGGGVAAAAATVCFSYDANGWGAFFGVLAALNIAGGSWYLSIDHSAAAQT